MSSAVRSIWLVLFLLFTSNLLCSQAIRTTPVLRNETDHSALLGFKESISKDPFGVLTSWNSSSHFCNWHGVTCGRRHQRVVELNLTGHHLQGSISPHVGNLSFLRNLLLGDNSFHGEVPQELGRLFRLQNLDFTNNTLGGEFPINLTKCSELRSLSLAGNHFIGRIPMEIGFLGKLQELYLHSNNLTGHVPASIGNLSSLTILSLYYNNLEGNVPEEIGNLKNLVFLSLGPNNMSGVLPPSLCNLSSLTTISIVQTQIHGSLPANMFLTLPNLEVLFLAGNKLSGQIPSSIANATKIRRLQLLHNSFVGHVPSLGKLQDLSLLSLGFNNLGSNSFNDLDFLMSLRNCSKLVQLDISYNNFGGFLPNFMGNSSFKRSMRLLYLGGNQISGRIPIEIGNLIQLIALGMESNLLIGAIPTTLGKLQNLQILVLFENKLSGEIPTSIGNLTQLSALELGFNMLVGNIPSTIGNCTKLGILHLSHNNLTGALPIQVFHIPSFSNLMDLSYNSFSGSLPVEVGMLKDIDLLDFSENSFSGFIPETIGECTTLEYLYIYGNSFHGSIPPSFASLKGLRRLDLSRNKLSGSIPQGLQNLSDLEYFNASFNMLEGEVPTNGVFHNASAISVTGYGKLCGGISELKLPPCPLKAMKRRKHLSLKLKVVILCLVVFLPICSCIIAVYLTRKRKGKISANSEIDQLPKVSYQNLHHATDGFSAGNLIGIGGHGSVYKGSLDSEERFVAIKVLNLQNKGAHKSFIAECNALKSIRHRNLVKVVTCCSSVDYNGNDFKAIVFEYMSNRSLEEWLHPENQSAEQSRTFNLEIRLEIIVGVASALHYLHYECEEPVIHCDLKPSNILLDDDMVSHVSDFGLARLLSTIESKFHNQISTSGIKGTIGYAPPEYGASSQVSTKGDMYSFGILILEMLTGKRPTEEMFIDANNLHNYVKAAFPNNIMEIADTTLLSMGNENPAETAAEENNISEIKSRLPPNAEKCLFSLFKIGLACSVDFPGERMNIMEVTRELNMIKKAFTGLRDRRLLYTDFQTVGLVNQV